MFPAEAYLLGLKPLMQRIHHEMHQIDATILATVRPQRNSVNKAKEDLANATLAARELSHNIQEINSNDEKSEATVQEICRDIKKLDFAKKNITTVITPIHRLTMLVSAVVQLQGMASNRQYKEAAAQLEAVNQLLNHFERNWDVPIITDVREKLENIKQLLKSHVFSDFSSLGTGKETEETNFLKKLSHSCLVVDALEPSVREELVTNFCSRELTSYEQKFLGAELTKLDEIQRIYNQINCHIRTNQEIWKIFPASWHVPYGLCIKMCKITRDQVESIMVNMKEKPTVARLLQELKRTLNFELELEMKFGGGVPTKNIGDDIEETVDGENYSPNVSEIHMMYEMKFAANHDLVETQKTGIKDLSDSGGRFNFRGIISSCFEPHLIPYIEEELMQCLEKVVQEETWDIDEENLNNILSSSRELFLAIKKSYDKCKALTKNLTLFKLFKVFQRVLQAYATKLFFKLSTGGTHKQIKVSGIDERVICYIVNSAEYCCKTSGDLAEEVSTIIDPHYADGVDMSEVQDKFSCVITKALMTLVRGLETKFDTEMQEMARVSWGTLESVGDHSQYVNGIYTILKNSVPVLGELLTPVYFQFFLEKLASSLGLRFYANIFRCKKISETGAQQMLLDTQAMEMILLNIPSLDRQTVSAASYSEFVKRQMSRAEAVLKVILSPIDSVANTYSALFPKGTHMKLQRILDLKAILAF
ncbi:vacuolar protein sorting-associated protein 53 A [Arabidopsis lyrata subsp. lyrata]|uniref:vacuolar protein sorting-associated protein 53 A n=1 Tax=Arabidopsis lyrata subsp. lyrata TaxID=81972 RepID=UPI000A29BB8E|nr:vacuolar protein sorting-associated protein 53 A [Arabidopsis lyrata subsp. lyrata]|eukprot:XP_020866344.1 vacuolar protein sorting-associated protein 53 A [Arabidopsis lyrata subsp. lyrata]